MQQRPRALSGMQPTGELHLGNYLGALNKANIVPVGVAREHHHALRDGGAKAHALAEDTMREVRCAMGLTTAER